MPTIRLNDMEMYYEVHGRGEPIVFISGFGGDHLGWLPVLNDFVQDFQVILFCNRGSGMSASPEGDFSIAQMAEDVIALCDALKLSSAYFVGCSMGGMIAQRIAYAYPARVKKVVMSNTAMHIHSVFRFYLEAQLEMIKANVSDFSVTKALLTWLFTYDFLAQPDFLPQLIALKINNPNPFGVRGYEGQYAALSKFDSTPWVHDIQSPTLVLTSDADIIFPPAVTKKLHERIKNSRFYCFENNAHLPHIENPKQYVSVLKDFFKETTV